MLRIKVKYDDKENFYTHQGGPLIIGRNVANESGIEIADPYISSKQMILEELPEQHIKFQNVGRNSFHLSDGRRFLQGEHGTTVLPVRFKFAYTEIYIDVPMGSTTPIDPAEDATHSLLDPRVGEVVENFEILERLGAGSMGLVFKARDLEQDRIVALKFILAGLRGKDSISRFKVEAQAVSKLDHPGVVRLLRFGDVNGRAFLSMDYVAGKSLAERCRGGFALHPIVSTELVRRVADAVAYSHNQLVIHRDLKPSNILIDNRGKPHLVDFGLAKLMDASLNITNTGDVLGTPAYMSPEQAVAGKIGPGVDVFALGGILFRLLTGRPPNASLFDLQSPDYAAPSALALNSNIPARLESICKKCLAAKPAERYPAAIGLANDLREWLDERTPQGVEVWTHWSRHCAGHECPELFSSSPGTGTLTWDV